jgi:hypothetical protein
MRPNALAPERLRVEGAPEYAWILHVRVLGLLERLLSFGNAVAPLRLSVLIWPE